MFNTTSSAQKADAMANQAAQAADQAIAATQRVTNGAFDGLSHAVHDLRADAAPLLNQAADQADALVQRGMDSLRGADQQVRDAARHATDSTVNYIREEPVKAMLIAAATGAALMALLSLMTRSRHPHA